LNGTAVGDTRANVLAVLKAEEYQGISTESESIMLLVHPYDSEPEIFMVCLKEIAKYEHWKLFHYLFNSINTVVYIITANFEMEYRRTVSRDTSANACVMCTVDSDPSCSHCHSALAGADCAGSEISPQGGFRDHG